MTVVQDRPLEPAQAGPEGPAAAGPRSGAPWFAVTAAVLAGVAPLLLLASTDTGRSSPWVAAYALAVVAGLRYAWLVAEGAHRLYEQIFWLFTYTFMCLAPLVQVRTGIYPGTTPNIDESLNGPALLVVAVGCASFLMGALLSGRPRPSRRDLVERVVAPDRVGLLTAGALAVTLLYIALVGPSAFFSPRQVRAVAEAAAFDNTTVRAVASAAARLPLLVAFAALVQVRRRRVLAGERAGWLLPVVVLVALAVVVNPISSPRYVAGTAVLAVLTSLGATSTTGRARLFALVLAAGLVLVFPYADITRRATTGDSGVNSGGPVAALSSSDFDAFDQVNTTIAYVRDEGYEGARQLAGAALFFVPRGVWPDKPEDTGVLLGQYQDAPIDNLSAPVWAELYLAGGMLTLVAGMFLLGRLLRRLDARAVLARARGARGGVLGQIMPFYMIIMLRGSLLQAMAGFTVLLVSGALVTRRLRPHEPVAALR